MAQTTIQTCDVATCATGRLELRGEYLECDTCDYRRWALPRERETPKHEVVRLFNAPETMPGQMSLR